MTGLNPAAKWDELERLAWSNVAVLEELLASIGTAVEELRVSRGPPVRYPPQFKSEAEWRAWCEEDRRAEVAEQFETVRSDALSAMQFESRFEVDPPAVTRSCSSCGHQHGGRAYGLCLVDGCDCVAATRRAA